MTLIFESIKCPHCGSDDETYALHCGCCATCDNCGFTFPLKD